MSPTNTASIPVRQRLSQTDEAALKMGWQEVTSYAAQHMEAENSLNKGTWQFDTVDAARKQAQRLAAAQWLHYTGRLNEFRTGGVFGQ